MEFGKKHHYPLIRTIYLYLFSIVGLALLIVGGVRFLDMGLKAFVFTQAEEQLRVDYFRPPLPYSLEKIEDLQTTEELSSSDREAISQWLADYQTWKERNETVDPVTSRRHEEAAGNLAAILVGLPLYFYHWGVIKREIKKEKA